VTISPALSSDPTVDGNPATYLGNLALQYGDHHHLEIVRELPDGKTPDGQDTVNWVIGLDATRPFRDAHLRGRRSAERCDVCARQGSMRSRR